MVLVDAAGHLPLGPKTPEALHLSAEQALEEKLVSTLEPVTGAGNVRASVTLDYDRGRHRGDAGDLRSRPDGDACRCSAPSRSSGSQPVAAGVPGTASNAPNSQALPVYPQTDHAARNIEDRVRDLRRLEDRAPRGRESGPRAADDRGHRGQRPADAAGIQERMRPSGSRGRPMSCAI